MEALTSGRIDIPSIVSNMASFTTSSRPKKAPTSTSVTDSTLSKMVDAAAHQRHGVLWNHVLHYLKAHCVKGSSHNKQSMTFDSPLQSHYYASDQLEAELAAHPHTGESVLRQAMAVAPPEIVAALCHLGLPSAQAVDVSGRLPLHLICRYPCRKQREGSHDDDNDKNNKTNGYCAMETKMRILIQAYPGSLICRDDRGRTPLQYLLSFYSSRRSVEIVKFFTQSMQAYKSDFFELRQPIGFPDVPKPSSSKGVPCSAAICPDAIYGCLPLHYAAANGASLSVLEALLHVYPASKHIVDIKGRTALAWYLGAGGGTSLDGSTSKAEQRSSSDRMKPDVAMCKLLLSSRVARTVDKQQRSPLHWASILLAQQSMQSDVEESSHRGSRTNRTVDASVHQSVVKTLLDSYAGQVTVCDHDNMTPVMLLFDTAAKILEKQWRNKKSKHNPELQQNEKTFAGGDIDVPLGFAPTAEVLALFISSHEVASTEDCMGRLPIHAALQAASDTETIRTLLNLYPAAVLHTDENFGVPLHAALSPWTAESVHTDTIQLLLGISTTSTSKPKHRDGGATVDGRFAMKLEDAAGDYPIHCACRNGASVDVIRGMVERYPACSKLQTPLHELAIHLVVQGRASLLHAATSLYDSSDDATNTNDFGVFERLLDVARQKLEVLIPPLLFHSDTLILADSKHGFLPLHIAVLFEAGSYDTISRMLELQPSTATKFTKRLEGNTATITDEKAIDSIGGYSALDCHEICKKRPHRNMQEWHAIRELLFSFSPKLESHRHRQELLDRCVKIIRDELVEGQSYHLDARRASKQTPELDLTHSVSALEADFLQNNNRKSGLRRRRSPNKYSKMLASNKSRYQKNRKSKVSKATSTTLSRRTLSTATTTADTGVKSSTAESLKTSSSMYDNEDSGFDSYLETHSYGENDASSTSGDSDDASFSSGDDDTDTDFGTSSRETNTVRSPRSLYTTSGSYLPTTFEEGDFSFDDESTCEQSEFALSTQGSRYTDGSIAVSSRNTFDEQSRADILSDRNPNVSRAEITKIAAHTPRTSHMYTPPSSMSEVGLRLWTFLALYCDPNNPSDNYANVLCTILTDMTYSSVEELVSYQVPPFAVEYINRTDLPQGSCFRDVASPKCREVIHRTCYFLGRFDLQSAGINGDILVQRTAFSVTIRALEWIFTTEEKTNAKSAGVSEEGIWATGQVPAEVGVTFRAQKKNVWITFTKSISEYNAEVQSRKAIGCATEQDDTEEYGNIDRILEHYNACETERKLDRIYAADTRDARFNSVELFGEGSLCRKGAHDSICLSDFPYAIVFEAPHSQNGTLYDKLARDGLHSESDCSSILHDIAESLDQLHKNGILHCDVSLRHIVSRLRTSGGASSLCWVLQDLSFSLNTKNGQYFLGGIDQDGRALFSSSTVPPEMIAKLSPSELVEYRNYWKRVEELYGLTIDDSIIDPVVDLDTGSTYVIKCHFVPLTLSESEATLPYELVNASASYCDIWAIGLVAYTLLTGRSLFQLNVRSDRLLNYGAIHNWNPSPTVFEYVSDPIAQNMLVRLLSPISLRSQFTITSLLHHPYFSTTESTLTKKMANDGRLEAADRKRGLYQRLRETSEREFLAARTVRIQLWDFILLEQFYHSPTNIVHETTNRKELCSFSSSMMLLPYDLSLSPSLSLSKNFGYHLLQLSKACSFASACKDLLESSDSVETSGVLSDLSHMAGNFEDMQNGLASLATEHVELYRSDPMSILLKLVKEKVEKLAACYLDTGAFFYFIDELDCLPICDAILVPEAQLSTILYSCVQFMHLSSLYACALCNGPSGVSKLVGRSNTSDLIPDSWIKLEDGKSYALNKSIFMKEAKILENALSAMGQTHSRDDSLACIGDFLTQNDPTKKCCDIWRVATANMFLWTSQAGIKQLKDAAKILSFEDALADRKAQDNP